MGWIIALAVLLLIGILPIGVNAVYDANGAAVRLIAGPFRFSVYPQNKKKKQKTQKKKTKEIEETSDKGGNYKDFLPIIRLVLNLLVDLRRKIRINNLLLKIVLCGDDPCDLAVNYGRAWAALGNLMPHLERTFVIKKRDLEVECDFLAEKTTVLANVDITITVAGLFGLGFRHGFKIIKEYLNIMNKRKGGAQL